MPCEQSPGYDRLVVCCALITWRGYQARVIGCAASPSLWRGTPNGSIRIYLNCERCVRSSASGRRVRTCRGARADLATHKAGCGCADGGSQAASGGQTTSQPGGSRITCCGCIADGGTVTGREAGGQSSGRGVAGGRHGNDRRWHRGACFAEAVHHGGVGAADAAADDH